jgi:hypothetical protein
MIKASPVPSQTKTSAKSLGVERRCESFEMKGFTAGRLAVGKVRWRGNVG